MKEKPSNITVSPIAVINTDFKSKFGIPRQSGRVESLKGEITFLPQYRSPDTVRELEGFSHIWLLFDFTLAHKSEWSATVRPPRLGGNRRVGVFASRSPFRPNPIGLSAVRLEKILYTDQGPVLKVSGVDILDGTPILDIKPYLPSDCYPEAICGYADTVREHKLEVIFPEKLLEKIQEDKRQAAIDCLGEDPRPSYQDDGRIYGMMMDRYDIRFTVKEGTLIVIEVKVEQ
ncbi:MAG: tRNA (N6-threonylcarbamoyladenosine(37)-N6)-methyltransferase TrmO [Clostridia bacterium]|nr:tRNA (N6-threonylcarbamoyladenosine(37)-N6)-methyltransferase TrmO [Clostridia bacterium]